MERFKPARQARRFLAAHDQIGGLLRLRRDHVAAVEHRAAGMRAFEVWAEVGGGAAAADHRRSIAVVRAARPTQDNKLTVPSRACSPH